MKYSVSYTTTRSTVSGTFTTVDQVETFLKKTNLDTLSVIVKKEDDNGDAGSCSRDSPSVSAQEVRSSQGETLRVSSAPPPEKAEA